MTNFEQEQKTWIKSVRFSDLNGCPADSHIWLVLRKVGRDYVIHRFSHRAKSGYSSGIYKRLLDEALKVFDEEAKSIQYRIANSSKIIDKLNTIIDIMEVKRSIFVEKLQKLEATGYPQHFYQNQLNQIESTIKLLIESRDKLASISWIQ